MAVALKIGARDYLECSALTREGVSEVFQRAVRATLNQHSGKKRRCVVL